MLKVQVLLFLARQKISCTLLGNSPGALSILEALGGPTQWVNWSERTWRSPDSCFKQLFKKDANGGRTNASSLSWQSRTYLSIRFHKSFLMAKNRCCRAYGRQQLGFQETIGVCKCQTSSTHDRMKLLRWHRACEKFGLDNEMQRIWFHST